ncbi:germin-like protein 8-6 [Populus alba]|uniref:germin-like protein 8-6 n=1 Tax=Populus alba TaxID=43335 RepID=UPI00158F4A78|nr:germin-like protein 8-6 [Populus alba]
MAPHAAAMATSKHTRFRSWRANHLTDRRWIFFRAMYISTGKYTVIGQYPTAPRSARTSLKKGNAMASTVTTTTYTVLHVSLSRFLQKGAVLVFPINLVHFQRNAGHGIAVALAALCSQNPGVITIANAVFESPPKIPCDVLAKAFQLDKIVVNYLQSVF